VAYSQSDEWGSGCWVLKVILVPWAVLATSTAIFLSFFTSKKHTDLTVCAVATLHQTLGTQSRAVMHATVGMF
jgi:hypothetical protein